MFLKKEIEGGKFFKLKLGTALKEDLRVYNKHTHSRHYPPRSCALTRKRNLWWYPSISSHWTLPGLPLTRLPRNFTSRTHSLRRHGPGRGRDNYRRSRVSDSILHFPLALMHTVPCFFFFKYILRIMLRISTLPDCLLCREKENVGIRRNGFCRMF